MGGERLAEIKRLPRCKYAHTIVEILASSRRVCVLTSHTPSRGVLRFINFIIVSKILYHYFFSSSSDIFFKRAFDYLKEENINCIFKKNLVIVCRHPGVALKWRNNVEMEVETFIP